MKFNLYYAMHVDYEDPDMSRVYYISGDRAECVDWVRQNFQDFASEEFSDKFVEEMSEEDLLNCSSFIIRKYGE